MHFSTICMLTLAYAQDANQVLSLLSTAIPEFGIQQPNNIGTQNQFNANQQRILPMQTQQNIQNQQPMQNQNIDPNQTNGWNSVPQQVIQPQVQFNPLASQPQNVQQQQQINSQPNFQQPIPNENIIATINSAQLFVDNSQQQFNQQISPQINAQVYSQQPSGKADGYVPSPIKDAGSSCNSIRGIGTCMSTNECQSIGVSVPLTLECYNMPSNIQCCVPHQQAYQQPRPSGPSCTNGQGQQGTCEHLRTCSQTFGGTVSPGFCLENGMASLTNVQCCIKSSKDGTFGTQTQQQQPQFDTQPQTPGISTGNGTYVSPLKSLLVTSHYSLARKNPVNGKVRKHAGVDFNGSSGDPVYAAKSGIITHSSSVSGYGNLIKIDHGNGEETRYAHLSSFSSSKGQQVNAGDLIGKVGSTGFSTGPHLHFEIRHNGEPTDPVPILESAGLEINHNISK